MIRYISAALLCSLMLPAVSQTVDRTKPPKAQPAPVININDPQTFRLPNGIQVLVFENHKVPKVTVNYSIDRIPAIDEPGKSGTNALFGQMMREGTTGRSKRAFDEQVDQIGAMLNVGMFGGSVTVLTKYADKAVDLLTDALRNPLFPPESLEKLRMQAIQATIANEKNAEAISTRVMNNLSFGPLHPYGQLQTVETYKSITMDDVKQAYAKYITPDRGYLIFVGDINLTQAKAIAAKGFADWKSNKIQMVPMNLAPAVAATEIDVVDVPNAVQTVIKINYPMDYRLGNPDYFANLLGNEILGGSLSSRLFNNLREKHGFTYKAFSSYSADKWGSGYFTAYASVRNAVADSAVHEMVYEINTLRTEKVTPEELQNAKNLLSGRFALSFENPATVSRFAKDIATQQLPKDFYRTYLQKLNAVTAEEVLKAAQKYLPANLRIIMTGKAADFSSKLPDLKYPVKYYDIYAKPVAAAKGF